MVPWFGAGLDRSVWVVVVVLMPALGSPFTLGKLSQNNYMCIFTFILSGDWHELNCLHKECKLKLALQRSQPVTCSGQATQRQATSLDPLFSSTLHTERKHKNSQSSGAGDSYSGANLKRPTGFEEQMKQSFEGEQDRVSQLGFQLL